MKTYNLVEADPGSGKGWKPYGAAIDLWKSHDPEVIISGPSETGKTLAALQKLDALMWKYPNARGLIIRKTYKSTVASCLQTFQTKVVSPEVNIIGGTRPQMIEYPNGSLVWIGGMDNPDKVLSTEMDVIYCNQAEELTLDDWEKLSTRATGRAGNIPYAQLMGDCNPSHPRHWILDRSKNGRLKLLHSKHQDNPTLYDPQTGGLTAQGIKTMETLDALTGTRKSRLRDGLWVQAEGVVYPEFDWGVHVIPRFPIPDGSDPNQPAWDRFRVIDFGLVHPFVCGWWALDHDGRMYLYKEIYMTGRTVASHAKQINKLSQDEVISETICDHDAEDRQTLRENGIPNIPAKKDVNWGIGKVQDRLKIQKDGKPRIFFFQDSLVELDQDLLESKLPTQTLDEFGLYVWNDAKIKESPIKENDHGMDMVRYAVAYTETGNVEAEVQSFNPFYD